MMETINEEGDELIVLSNSYSKFADAVPYLLIIFQDEYKPSNISTEDCLEYYGNVRDRFYQLSNSFDTNYIRLMHLKDSTQSIIYLFDIYLMACENKISTENYQSAKASVKEYFDKAAKSEDTFLALANELLNKYKIDLYTYNIQVSQEQINKYEFWSQLFSALGSGISSEKNTISGGYIDSSGGINVYSRDECIGPVVAGECKGTIVPKGAWQKKCYGKMLFGKCTGPMF